MTEILDARAAVEQILDECALPAYLFTVEPKSSGWTLTVDCALGDAWCNVVLPVDSSELRASLHDAGLREKLRREWQPHLAGGLP